MIRKLFAPKESCPDHRLAIICWLISGKLNIRPCVPLESHWGHRVCGNFSNWNFFLFDFTMFEIQIENFGAGIRNRALELAEKILTLNGSNTHRINRRRTCSERKFVCVNFELTANSEDLPECLLLKASKLWRELRERTISRRMC